VPYGLFIVLGLYLLGVLGYVWGTYWRSPEYLAAEHWNASVQLLGVDDGRKCSQADLERAFDHLAEAARLMPRVRGLPERLERLRWRFDERGFKLSEDRKRRAEAVSAVTRRLEEAGEPWLVVGSRDRGWAPDQLMEAPGKVVWWSMPGGVIIILVWAYLRFSRKAVREREHEQELKKSEAEVKALGAFRQGLSPAPADDEVTAPRAPPLMEDAAPAAPKRPASSAGRAAVKAVSSPGRPSVKPASSPGRAAVKPATNPAGSKAVKKPPQS